MINNFIVIGTVLLVLMLLFKRSIRLSPMWRATVTPLASIIGSGFLISAPLLILTTGKLAVFVMLGIVIIAFALGSSLRYNIKYSEPQLEKYDEGSAAVLLLENMSRPVLGIAYIISVAFYLKLLAAFALRWTGSSSLMLENSLTTALLLFIGITGKIRGLSLLESLETYSVNIKLSIIVALVAGHIAFNFDSLIGNQWYLSIYPHEGWVPTIKKLLGMLIIIQGFETSRYLGHAYSAKIRIQSMKNAQIISGVIYVVFIASTLTAFNDIHSLDETTVIEVCKMIAPVLPFLLIIAAVMSQFSAAVADTIGSGGLLAEATKRKISVNTSYLFITCLGILLTWLTNIYTIITIASKAFSVYYILQLLISITLLTKQKSIRKNKSSLVLYCILLLLMFSVLIFSIPVKL
jgi:hypothetical protein